MSTQMPDLPRPKKLGILMPGLGAIASTLVAGVFAIQKGKADPVGSLTHMGRIRLGKLRNGISFLGFKSGCLFTLKRLIRRLNYLLNMMCLSNLRNLKIPYDILKGMIPLRIWGMNIMIFNGS